MLRCALLLLLLASCANPFRGIPTLLPVGYQATCQLAQDTLYLETQAKSKVVLTITPHGERAQGVSYVLQDWQLAGKMQGALLDAAGKPLQPGTKLTAGEHTFFYKPSTVGEHQLLLTLSDAYGDTVQPLSCRVQVADHQVVPFSLQLTPKPAALLTCQEGKLTLCLRSKDPKAKHLTYHLQALTIQSGSKLLAGIHPLAVGAPLQFGKQELTLQPTAKGSPTEERIALTVSNEKGDLSSVAAVLKLEKGTYQLHGQLAPRQQQHAGPLEAYPIPVEVHVRGVAPALARATWPLMLWRLKSGLQGTLHSGREALLLPHDLRAGKNKLTVRLAPCALRARPQLLLGIQGLYEEPLEVNIDLSEGYQAFLTAQCKALEQAMKKTRDAAQKVFDSDAPLAALEKAQGQVQEAQAPYLQTLTRLTQNMAVLQPDSKALAALPAALPAALLAAQNMQKDLQETLKGITQDIGHYKRLTRDINETDSCNYLPLHDAAASGDEAFVRFLLKRTHNINIETKYGQTPLDMVKKYSSLYNILQQAGGRPGIDGQIKDRCGREVNERDSRGRTLLFQAVYDKDLPLVEFLLRHPCVDMEAVIKNAINNALSATALLWAARKNYFEILKALVRRGADVNVCFKNSSHSVELTRHKIGDPDYGMKPKAYSHSTRHFSCPLHETSSEKIKAYLKDHGAWSRPRYEDYYDFEYERSGEWKEP